SVCLAQFGPLGEEGDLGRGRFAAEDRVAVRKSAEALDNLKIRSAVTAQRSGAVGIAWLGFEQSPRPALVVEILTVMKRHIEKPSPDRRNPLVEAALERPVGGGAGRRIGRVGARRAAEDVARDLIEQQHQSKRALRQRLPRRQRSSGGGLVIGEKVATQ